MADEYYDKRMAERAKQVDEEIARAHELKKLELQTRILAQELALQRGEITVSTEVNQGQSSYSESHAEATNDVDFVETNQRGRTWRSKRR